MIRALPNETPPQIVGDLGGAAEIMFNHRVKSGGGEGWSAMATGDL
jgi:hypothetical protein